MIAYTYIAPTLQTEDEQLVEIWPYDAHYGDKHKRRDARQDMIKAALLRKEDVTIATAAVLGSGDDLRRVLRQLGGHGITLHIADIGESIALTDNVSVITDMPEWTKASNMSKRGQKGYEAAKGKVGRKSVTTATQDSSMRRMAKTHSLEEVAVAHSVSLSTVRRRVETKES